MLNGFSVMTTGVSGGLSTGLNTLPTISQSTAAMLNGFNVPTPGASAGINAQGTTGDPLGTRGDMGVAVQAGLRELDSLARLVKQLSGLPFHKTVLLMSTGLTRPPEQLEYWKSVVELAIKGGVTFYALDVWGLGVCQDSGTSDCVTASSASAPARRDDSERPQASVANTAGPRSACSRRGNSRPEGAAWPGRRRPCSWPKPRTRPIFCGTACSAPTPRKPCGRSPKAPGGSSSPTRITRKRCSPK